MTEKTAPTEIRDLVPNPANPREMDDETRAAFARSLERFGDLGQITFNRRSGQLVSGHQRVAELQRGGAQMRRTADDDLTYLVHPATGERFPVRVVDWDEVTEEAALVAANSKHLQGRFTAALGPMVLRLQKLNLPLTKDLRLGLLLKDLPKRTGRTEDDDDLPAIPAKPYSEVGDVWQCGPHRVSCVDSLGAEWRETLIGGIEIKAVVCDPPYAIYGSSTGVSSEVADDKMVRPFFEKVLDLAGDVLPWFGHAYVCCDWRTWPAIWEAARRTPMSGRNLIVWDKGGGLGSNYSNNYELVGFFGKLPPTTATGTKRAVGVRLVNRPNLQRFGRVRGDEREHNAAKPVALFEEFVRNSSDAGAAVLDPFMGSGTTVIACERTARVAVAADIEPRWVDVTVLRWQRLTGQLATHAVTGRPFGEPRT